MKFIGCVTLLTLLAALVISCVDNGDGSNGDIGDSGDSGSENDVLADSKTHTDSDSMSTLLATDSQSDDDTSAAIMAAFFTSGCLSDHSNSFPALLTGIEAEDYAGLNCILWTVTDDGVMMDLLNQSAGCGIGFEGTASLSDDTLILELQNPGCVTSNCGNCLYNWSFNVALGATRPATIAVTRDICPDDDYPATEHARVPFMPEHGANGIQCIYPSIDPGNLSNAACGALHQPCRPIAGDTDISDINDFCATGHTPCNDGLVCVDTFTYPQYRCVAACNIDADCPLPAILSCQDGRCLLK
ncbi:MAG: hypothetical protein JXX14_26135 [Deltaproteobacteria bacterium]|nr:hypothetical protein [Deltaproteobacteria bacterium]